MFEAGCGLGRFCWLLVGAGEPTFCVVRVVVVGEVVTREPPDDDVVGLTFGALHARTFRNAPLLSQFRHSLWLTKMRFTYGVFFEVVGDVDAAVVVAAAVAAAVVGLVRCGPGRADDDTDAVLSVAALVGVGLCRVDVAGAGVVVRFDGLRDVVVAAVDVGKRNVVSSWTDWNVCNLMFSVVVGMVAVVRFRTAMFDGSFSKIACSWLASVLPIYSRRR